MKKSIFRVFTIAITTVVSSAFLMSCGDTSSKSSLSKRIIVYALQDVKEGQIISDNLIQEHAIAAPANNSKDIFIHCRLEAIGQKAKFPISSGQILQYSDLNGNPKITDFRHSSCPKTKAFTGN